MILLNEIPYRTDSTLLFEGIADRPWAVFLDSGRPKSRGGRYDILAADPSITLVTRGGLTEIRSRDAVSQSEADPFALLRDHLGAQTSSVPGLPFCGGALGWFAYDLGRRIEQLPAEARDAEQLPDMAVGIYDWAVVVDHDACRSYLVGQGRDPSTRRKWWSLRQRFSQPPPRRSRPPFRVTGAICSNLSREDYGRAFARVKTYIEDGDCYQVNLAQRFAAPAEGDTWGAFRQLRELSPAPFSAYLRTPYAQVMSASPERFLEVRGDQVETRPIKGTRPRSGVPEADSALVQELAGSVKDRAENVMIVDLLRNDLGRVCTPGSVAVPSLCAVQSFSNVHHLVSTVTGRLAPGHDALSALRACFPGGSITGAPKIRAMQIIEALEPHRRGVYCGSIGYVGFDGAMDTSIVIRTLAYNHEEVRCWAGGGIVHDSTEAAEYQETLDKAAAMLRLLEGPRLALVGG